MFKFGRFFAISFRKENNPYTPIFYVLAKFSLSLSVCAIPPPNPPVHPNNKLVVFFYTLN